MKKMSFFFLGSLLTAIIMSCFTVYGESAVSITAIFGRIKLVVNDRPIAQETLLYKDTTYVPLRAVAEMLGKEVAYESSTKTAYIDEKGTNRKVQSNTSNVQISTELKALNMVRDFIAGDDDSVFEPLSPDGLSYRYRNSSYRIEYNNKTDEYRHLIQEYEVVIHDHITGEGHTSTSNWYTVDISTGEVVPMFDY